jgi:hypothetical protein
MIEILAQIQQQVNPTQLSPFEWVSAHIQLIGWPVLIVVAWRARGFVAEFTAKANAVHTAVTKWDGNHLPHMEQSLADQTTILQAHTTVLGSIDKGIGLLVDRNPRS